ncbi:MAG: hypothetical protein KKE73_06200 [Proteobacteria bacterium]|nr:hypothetical protein [Pseudomonadota bacterium]
MPSFAGLHGRLRRLEVAAHADGEPCSVVSLIHGIDGTYSIDGETYQTIDELKATRGIKPIDFVIVVETVDHRREKEGTADA